MIIEEKLSAPHMLAYIATLLGLFVLLQWHDAYTEARIAELDAQSVRTVACDEPVDGMVAVAVARK